MQSKLIISLKKIQKNWNYLNVNSKNNAAAVVKANAYGFGMIPISKSLAEIGCNFFYVAQLEEGLRLRDHFKSRKINIAIFEGLIHDIDYYQRNNLIPIINNVYQFKKIIKFNSINKEKQFKGILNVDTGMNRLGFEEDELLSLNNLKEFITCENFIYVMSHLSNANDPNDKQNLHQLNKLLTFKNNLKNTKFSLANTNGILLGNSYILDQTRPGVGIYGIDANGYKITLNDKKLNFPFVLKCPIIQIRNVKKGQRVSYGGITKLQRNSKLATIGIGYADGILRFLKNQIHINIKGVNCKIIGSITMDSLIIDITDLKELKLNVGDYIDLINEKNFFQNFIKNSNINIYELFTNLSDRINKNYI